MNLFWLGAGSLVFAGLFFAVYCLYTVFKYTRMIGNIFLSLVYDPSLESLPESARGEAVTILDSSDAEISALFLEKKDSKKLVIFCHESGATKESWEKYCFFFPDLGYHVLSLDFKNEAMDLERNSFSQWPTVEDVNLLLTAILWAKKVCPAGTQVALFGVSKGANIALAASFHEEAVKAIVADGLFSMKEIFRAYIRKWAPVLVKPNFFGDKTPEGLIRLFADLGFDYCQKKFKVNFLEVERLLKKKHAPLLLIYGRQDNYVSAPHQDTLEKINRGPTLEKFLVADAGHNEAVVKDRESYERTISEFLAKL
jgi:pimeloyl-ACP methyl ester carboxylesterase